jgi:transcriptional regulator with XRE-family HTH domain
VALSDHFTSPMKKRSSSKEVRIEPAQRGTAIGKKLAHAHAGILGEGRQGIDRSEVGARIRARRKATGLTLNELARISGVALSTISKAERGDIGLTYDKFGALARALDLDFADLFGPHDEPMTLDASVTRKAEEVVYDADQYRYGLIAADRPNKRMIPMYARITARSVKDFSDYVRHEGEEFVYVLRGSLRIEFEIGVTYELGVGDSLYFNSSIGHLYISTGRGTAEALVTCVGADPSKAGVL